MIGCDVQITPLDDDDRALLARYAARKATAARTYATAQLGSLQKAQFVAAAQMPETDCPACGAPLRYARAARPLKLESTE